MVGNHWKTKLDLHFHATCQSGLIIYKIDGPSKAELPLNASEAKSCLDTNCWNGGGPRGRKARGSTRPSRLQACTRPISYFLRPLHALSEIQYLFDKRQLGSAWALQTAIVICGKLPKFAQLYAAVRSMSHIRTMELREQYTKTYAVVFLWALHYRVINPREDDHLARK